MRGVSLALEGATLRLEADPATPPSARRSAPALVPIDEPWHHPGGMRPRPTMPWRRAPRSAFVGPAAVGYAVLAALASGAALALRDGVPWVHPSPWLHLRTAGAAATSAALGLTLAFGLILLTRAAVARYGWARRFHAELRPVARGLSLGDILLLSGLSSLGEELLFRGLLAPWLGVVLSSLLFGLAHQIKGPSRWIWVSWATGVGLGLGAIFALTGSLVGPLLAHAVVNAVNLAFLRDYDPDRRRA